MPSQALMALLSGEVSPETDRLGVYALAAIVGLVVSALITIAKDVKSHKTWLKQQRALARVHSFL